MRTFIKKKSVQKTGVTRAYVQMNVPRIESLVWVCKSTARSLKSLAQDSTVPDSGDQAKKVDQARDAMHTAELLVQGQHLLGVRRRVIAPLAIAGF